MSDADTRAGCGGLGLIVLFAVLVIWFPLSWVQAAVIALIASFLL